MKKNLNAGSTPIICPELLTPKAFKIARGEHVNGISEADWESYLMWEERCDVLFPVKVATDCRLIGYRLAIQYRYDSIIFRLNAREFGTPLAYINHLNKHKSWNRTQSLQRIL